MPIKEITAELLFAVAKHGQQRPRNDEKQQPYLARQTHIHLNNKGLQSSALPAGICPNLKALYLFENKIEKLADLGALLQLTHLYVQDNQISSFDLAGLQNLRKLYINGNCLRSLAPLAQLHNLEELHAGSQRLSAGVSFDPAGTVLASLRGLRVLDLSNNNLESTEALVGCRALQTVNLAKNRLSSLASVAPLLLAAQLVELDCRGNSVSESRKNVDSIVVTCPSSMRTVAQTRDWQPLSQC